ncbi:MAG: fimbrillin family protein, partial [Alistipes sp.]
MKKTFLSGLLLFVAAVTLSNCSKDETTDPTVRGNQLRAAVEEPTRTSLDGTIVTWELKDKIKVVNQNAP